MTAASTMISEGLAAPVMNSVAASPCEANASTSEPTMSRERDFGSRSASTPPNSSSATWARDLAPSTKPRTVAEPPCMPSTANGSAPRATRYSRVLL